MAGTRFEIEAVKKYANLLVEKQKLECPISHEPLEQPVYHEVNGVKIIFSRAPIETWLKTHTTCPETRIEIRRDHLLVYHYIDVLASDMDVFYHDGTIMSDEQLEQNLDGIRSFLLKRFFREVLNFEFENLQTIFGDHIPEFVNQTFDDRLVLNKVLRLSHVNVPKMVSFLINNGASLELSAHGDRPLHVAVSRKMSKCVEILLKAGAKVFKEDFIAAAQYGIEYLDEENIVVMKLLYDCKHDFNLAKIVTAANNGLLYYQSEIVNNSKMLIQLVKAGCDPNARNDAGLTPLHMGVNKNRNSENIQAILALGANVLQPDNKGELPATVNSKISYSRKDFDPVLKLLKLAEPIANGAKSVVFLLKSIVEELKRAEIFNPSLLKNNVVFLTESQQGFQVDFAVADYCNTKYILTDSALASDIRKWISLDHTKVPQNNSSNCVILPDLQTLSISIQNQIHELISPQPYKKVEALSASSNSRSNGSSSNSSQNNNIKANSDTTHHSTFGNVPITTAVQQNIETPTQNPSYRNVNLIGKEFTLDELEGSPCLVGVIIDQQTFVDNGFTSNGVKILKNTVISHYKSAIRDFNDFDALLKFMLTLSNDKQNILRLARPKMSRYIDTSSYKNVLIYGQRRLIELANTDSYVLNINNTDAIKTVFKKNLLANKSDRNTHFGSPLLKPYEDNPIKLLMRATAPAKSVHAFGLHSQPTQPIAAAQPYEIKHTY